MGNWRGQTKTKRHMFRLLIFLFSFNVAFGQFVESAKKFNLSIPVPTGWTIEQQSIFQRPGENEKLFVKLVKQKQDTGRVFLDVVVTYNEESEMFCDHGYYVKVDTVKISGLKAKRWFGENCGWKLNCNAPASAAKNVAGYSIDYLVQVTKTKFLIIRSDYFSSDEGKREQFKNEIISFANSIKIKKP
jgi:hypothetical protein